MEKYISSLNNDVLKTRLEALEKLMEGVGQGIIKAPEKKDRYVNNHIHTTYSFSPYSPTKALWMAYNSGLTTAGIMDHDSIAGALEFIEAGKIVGIATTVGIECRVDFSNTALKGRRINNPDQDSIVYMALHGIPHTQIDAVQQFFAPYREERNKRNREMTERLNDIMKPFGIQLDFDKDIVPISKSDEGGSITERHILFALSKKLIEGYGRGRELVNFLKGELNIPIKARIEEYLLNTQNEFYEYDLLGVIKSDLVSMFYIDATAECPDVREVIDFSNRIGAISAYAYLGDVEDSVTGDKKSQKFEDDYLDLLFEVIKDLGFNAVTYMPSRNTMAQLKRVKELCHKFQLFEISGEDINSPRQSFICDALQKEEFANLVDSTWALIGHEKAATMDISDGMFSSKTIRKYPDLEKRIQIYKELGKSR